MDPADPLVVYVAAEEDTVVERWVVGSESGLRPRLGSSLRLCVAAAVTLTVGSCDPGGDPKRPAPPTHGAFEDHFTLVRSIVLEERGDSVLSSVGFFVERPEGGFLVGDLHIPWLRVHADDGSLVRVIGRFGDGPGEFRSVTGAVEVPAGVYVADSRLGRITRFASDWSFDTIFTFPGYPHEMHRWGEMMVMELAGLASGLGIHVLSEDLRILSSFRPIDSLVVNTPYWRSFSLLRSAVLGGDILTVDNFLYPVQVFDSGGRLVRTFGTEPPSWTRAPLLALAELTGPDMMAKAEAWLRLFTVIDRIDAYRDAYAILTHARNVPTATDLYGREHYALDVYDAQGRKLLEDIPVPGMVLGAGRYLYVVLKEPPDPWTVGLFEMKAPGS